MTDNSHSTTAIRTVWNTIQSAAGAPRTGGSDLETARSIIDRWFPNITSAGKSESELWKVIQQGVGMRPLGKAGRVTAEKVRDTLVDGGRKSDWKTIQIAAGVTPVDGIPGKLTAQGIMSTWMPNTEPASTTTGVWKQIQQETGTAADGIPGNRTAAAIMAKWIDPPQGKGDRSAPYPDGADEAYGGFDHLYPDDLIDDNAHRQCVETISVFESGAKTGGYSTVSVYGDGPGGARQITYGRCQTTESGNLKELLTRYVHAGTGTDAAGIIADRLPQVGRRPYLVNDRALSRHSGMRAKNKRCRTSRTIFLTTCISTRPIGGSRQTDSPNRCQCW